MRTPQQTGRKARILVVHPGASWSTADVFDGLTFGLRHWDQVEVLEYRLDGRLEHEHKSMAALYRRAKKAHAKVPKPTKVDTVYKASVDVVGVALKECVDVVIVMSAMFFHPAALLMLRRANTKVVVLCTESPYDLANEVRIAGMLTQPTEYAGRRLNPLSGVWTNERSSVPAFQAVNAYSSYLPHAWHPERHTPDPQPLDASVLPHDVVFVGTGTAFRERVEFFEGIDWTGINLGLYGSWEGLRAASPLRAFVREKVISNRMAAALYRRSKISLNFYRKSEGWGAGAPRIAHAESLNPRAYELAACGAFHLCDPRAEVTEKFGDLVPTFTTAGEAEALIRHWLADDAGRAAVAAQLPACVAEDSWVHRARQVIGDLRTLLQSEDGAAA